MMKKITCILLSAIIFLSGFSQSTDSLYQRKQDLLLKSKNQKTAAFVLCGLGGVAIVAGLAGLSKEELETGFGESSSGNGAATAMLIGGAVSMGIGTFLAIESGKNKKQAAQISAGMKWEKTTPLAINNNNPVLYPAVSLQLRLNQKRERSTSDLQR